LILFLICHPERSRVPHPFQLNSPGMPHPCRGFLRQGGGTAGAPSLARFWPEVGIQKHMTPGALPFRLLLAEGGVVDVDYVVTGAPL